LSAKVQAWVDRSEELESFSAEEILAWAFEAYHPRIALACSFQVEESVLIDMMHSLRGSDFRIFTLDTGRLNQETYDCMDAIRERYGVRVEAFFHGHRHAHFLGEGPAQSLLLIGGEALSYQRANTQYPYEIDLAIEWWLWQHLPFVFAVWAVRKDLPGEEKKRLERSLSGALGVNQRQLDAIAREASERLAIPAQELQDYLAGFIYRLSQPEEDGIARFTELVYEHHLL